MPPRSAPAVALVLALAALSARPCDRAWGQDVVLPPNPGLDRGTGGHWGVLDDADWVDGRWNATDVGPFLATSLELPSGWIAKALAVRTGDAGGATVCYDTETLSLRAGWTGGFLRSSPKRFGLIEMPRVEGEIAFLAPAGPAWGGRTVRYRGLHVSGRRTVLAYETGGVEVLESPWSEAAGGALAFSRTLEVAPADAPLHLSVLAAVEGAAIEHGAAREVLLPAPGGTTLAAALVGFPSAHFQASRRGDVELVLPAHRTRERVKVLVWKGPDAELAAFRTLRRRSPPPADLRELARPAPRRWGDPLMTIGRRGRDDGAYAIDTISVPYENPYRALLFLSGLDFFADGSIAVSAVHGDVWLVRGVDAELERVSWQRFATGLYQPLGLRIVDGRVYVLGRDRITRLHDLDGDGEADFYESFSSDCETSTGGHDYHTCLETDAAGNFYYVSPRGLHRISRDGKDHETIATGWRNPNGLSVGPDGTITVAPQEGEWTPASQISEVRPGGYYGYGGPKRSRERPLGYDPPLVYLPRHADNSSGGQVWVTSSRWGPLEGQLLNLSFGRSSMQLVLRDRVGSTAQGAAVPLRGRFLSGAVRGRFHPLDGQLYVAGMQGWVTNAIADGSLQRVRYTGGKAYLPIAFRAHEGGLHIVFSEPVDPALAGDPRSYAAREWQYRYSSEYGSEEWSVRFPDRTGHDPVAVRSATVLENGREVFLEMPELCPVMQLHVRGSIDSADGADMSFDIYATIHRLRAPFDAAELAEPAAEELDGIDLSGERGLVLRLESMAGNAIDARVVRLAALRVPAGEPPSPFFEPGPFRAVASGFLRLEERTRARFSLESSGRARLAIRGRTVLEGSSEALSGRESEELVLERGKVPLVLEYESPERGDAWIRLLWSGRDFPREPVPPAVLGHAPGDPLVERGRRLRRARELVAEKRCLRCHIPSRLLAPDLVMPELLDDAPSFEGIGSRLRASWMAHWVASPASLRPAATMPDLLAGDDGASVLEAGDTRPWDIAAFLATLVSDGGDDLEHAEAAATGEDESLRGGELFAALGCIACHTRPDVLEVDAVHGRLPLASTAWKWKPAALVAFLERPSRHYRSIAMPDFRLAQEDARAIASFLLSRSVARGPPQPPLAGDAEKGKELLRALRCAACHAGTQIEAPAAPSFAAIAAADWEARGCVASTPAAGTPRFRLVDSERQALRELARGGLPSLFRRSLPEAAGRAVVRLGCTGCHDRDGEPSRWSELESETAGLASKEPTRITVTARPDLTHTGDKLRADWHERLLAGELDYTLRPWLRARMPAFPDRGRLLARGLALEHGRPFAPDPEEAHSLELLETGRMLLGTRGGFSCVTCHSIGSEPARMELHFGVVNLAHARERLRRSFYTRWMLNPQRIDPRTMMPAYTDERGGSVLAAVCDGDGRKQFAAIWEFLGTLRNER